MWEPEPGWLVLPGGSGVSTVGVWRTVLGDRAVAVKRVAAPDDFDPAELTDPRHFAYWRRAADVATYGLVDATPGLRAPRMSVEEDADGLTIIQDWVEDAANSGLFIAHAIGRFAAAELGHVRWLARNQLRDRLARVERRGGWSTLGRTTASDIADSLWRKRGRLLDELDRLPQVAQHGDPVPGNLLGREGDELVAVDWGSLGYGPVGADLGFYLLMAREEFEPLLDAYLLGLPDGVATREQVTLGAQVTAVYTVFTRADWALARVVTGEGALGAKFRHPSVAPHLRALQRQSDAVEALLDR
ncbi:Phosphotransferase enzyme family protein [Nocardioides terrae]|uniref:Phosphotransferase enzyme family protein n=1 Tax=Nocardioides terrae TaxID=574651 RepID=A0A1I1JZ15_9ACTN|nr:phosphotransferase [Nocardioides terrae]SFC50993.1 Phosphotransferase enzyme family protein [Nocardioides terrae]